VCHHLACGTVNQLPAGTLSCYLTIVGLACVGAQPYNKRTKEY